MPVRNTAKLGAVLRKCPIVLMDTEQKVSSKHVKIPGQWRVRARTRDQRTTTSWFDLTPGPPHRSHRRGARGAFRADGLRLASDSADETVRLWPAGASREMLCARLAANMSHRQGRDWVSPHIGYITNCPGTANSGQCLNRWQDRKSVDGSRRGGVGGRAFPRMD